MIVLNTWSSIVKLTQGLITAANTIGAFSFIDWDAHANIHEIPNVDLIGPTTFAISEDDKVFDVNFSIGVSTYDDPNLFRMRAMMNLVFDRLRPEKKIVYYDSVTTQPRSWMVVTNGTTMSPMTRSEVRPFQFVQVECLLEPTAAT